MQVRRAAYSGKKVEAGLARRTFSMADKDKDNKSGNKGNKGGNSGSKSTGSGSSKTGSGGPRGGASGGKSDRSDR
jgi:hypothetical protein